jgi:type IV fimbrial biogenesis protein FimT
MQHAISLRMCGFTLIELMVTVVVLSILIGVGVPSFTAFVQDSRVSAATNRVASVLNYARSEASTRANVITLERTSASANNWALGWEVYTDADPLGNTTRAGADTLLRSASLAYTGVSVASNAAAETWISYRTDGMLNEAGNAIVIAICDERGEANGRDIQINLAGRVSVVSPSADCSPA